MAKHYKTSTVSGPRVLVSKFDSPCKLCGTLLKAGESVMWNPAEKGVWHVDAALCASLTASQTPEQAALLAEMKLGGWAEYPSKYASVCKLCNTRVAVGSKIWWRRVNGQGESRHPVCPAVSVTPVSTPAAPVALVASVIPDGKYTLIVADESEGESAYMTFKVATSKQGKSKGKTRFSVKVGHNWIGLGWVSGSEIVTYPHVYEWNNFITHEHGPEVAPEQVAAWVHIGSVLLAGGEVHLQAGLIYAMRSNECWHCGHDLTVPASLHRGVGPNCAKKLGLI